MKAWTWKGAVISSFIYLLFMAPHCAKCRGRGDTLNTQPFSIPFPNLIFFIEFTIPWNLFAFCLFIYYFIVSLTFHNPFQWRQTIPCIQELNQYLLNERINENYIESYRETQTSFLIHFYGFVPSGYFNTKSLYSSSCCVHDKINLRIIPMTALPPFSLLPKYFPTNCIPLLFRNPCLWYRWS